MYLGDIVISLETAASQATKANWSLLSEVILLGIHGLLHLLGYEDETEDGALLMQERTVGIINAANMSLPPGGEHPFFTRQTMLEVI